MSSKYVRGKDVLVYEVIGEVDHLIVCAKSCTINKVFDKKETTHYASTAKEYKAGMSEWGISLEGLVTLEGLAADQKTIWDFMDGTTKNIKMTFADGDGNTKSATGQAFAYSNSITAGVSDFAGYSMELQGTGTLTIS